MELKKLFTKKSKPQNIGKTDSQDGLEPEMVSKYYLEFPDLDGKPTYELNEILTIGSEIGDIILEEEISPKHCTFSINQDVISLMDHSSQEGTFINKKPLDSGRIYILQEKDKIKIGSLSINLIHTREENFSSEQLENDLVEGDDSDKIEVPELPTPVSAQIDNTQEINLPPELSINENKESTGVTNILEEEALSNTDIDDELLEDTSENESVEEDHELDYGDVEISDEIDEKTRKILKASGSLKGKKKPLGKAKLKGSVRDASSALTRVLAIIIECLIIFVSMSLFKSNAEFLNILQVYPTKLLNIVAPYYIEFAKPYMDLLVKEAPFLTKAFEDIQLFFSSNMDILYGLILFALIRIVTPIVFGVSLGQALIGITGSGNFFLKRILGVLRELLGLILAPFLIFDISTLISNRSLKEVITFTHIETKSNTKTILLCLLWIPGIIVFFLLSPILLEETPLYPIPVNQKTIVFKPIELAEVSNIQYSKQLELNFNLTEDYIAMPYFQLKRTTEGKSLVPWFNIINMKTNSNFTISKTLSFDLKKLLASAIKDNYLSSWKYDKIHAYVNDIANSNKNFTNSTFSNPDLYKQIQNLVTASLNLNFESIIDHIKVNGPFLGGYLSFRKNLLNLVELNEASTVEVKQIGDSPFLVVKNKKNIYAIQLNRSKSNIYKIGRSGKDSYSIDLKNSVWKLDSNYSEPEVLNFISFSDTLLSDNEKSVEFFQKSYELFFEYGKKVMISDNNLLLNNLSFTLNNLVNVLETIKSENKDKFVQNTNDLLKAVKDKDKRYFGISDIKSAQVK